MLFLGRISLITLFIVAAILAFGSAAHEVSEERTDDQKVLEISGAAPELSARSYVVFDVETGDVLYGRNENDVRPIASVTKLFAAAAVHDLFDLEATTTIAWADVAAHGSAGRLSAQQTYSYRELLFPLLLSSSNDAALTYERRSQQDGVDLLPYAETLAERHGAHSIQFADASGLSDKNVASAHDLARTTAAIYASHPYVFSISRLPSYLGPYHGWQNNSPFADDASYVGGKHGYTNAAGRTAVVLFTESLTDEDRTLGYVVLGSDDIAGDVALLRAHVYDSVAWR